MGSEELVSEWPQLDPITGRMICRNCFNGIHYHELLRRKNQHGVMETYYERRDKLTPHATHACDGECDCIHRSEENWAAIEQLEDPQNPLLAINHDHKPKTKGKAHA